MIAVLSDADAYPPGDTPADNDREEWAAAADDRIEYVRISGQWYDVNDVPDASDLLR